jgi:hypothetical protein
LVGHVLCCPGNAGTAREGGKISNNSATAAEDLLSFIQQNHNNIDMVVIGPEGPLVDGFVTSLQLHCPQTRVFGPTKEAAQLEASKVNTTQHVLGELDIYMFILINIFLYLYIYIYIYIDLYIHLTAYFILFFSLILTTTIIRHLPKIF